MVILRYCKRKSQGTLNGVPPVGKVEVYSETLQQWDIRVPCLRG